ncbi:MAG TPA: UvrD-helicase domain-containing protein [Chloroflexota bacterium]|nr:UvrD-helicase domain-containing protein [Chloroflexota bacterium]
MSKSVLVPEASTSSPTREVDPLLEGLNEPQAGAVAEGDGAVLVFAGAGSGKTRVLTRRVAYLIRRQGVRPWNILAVTFTNKAAAEMRERVTALTGDEGSAVWLGTFHSICTRILRREGRDFSIYDADDQKSVMKKALSEAQIGESRLSVGGALAGVSRLKNELIRPETFEPSTYSEELIRRVYPVYQEQLARSNAYDFDDLIMKVVELLRSDEEKLQYYSSRFRHVLVDEYQDTNHAQYVLMNLFASEYRNLFAVGDADQAIYGWRGADIRNILDFERHYPEARLVVLDQNYRSTQNILAAAHAVITKNVARPKKRLWTEKDRGSLIRVFEGRSSEDEAHFIAREIRRLTHRGTATAGSCAVMYRTNAQSRAIEEAFIHEGIRYRLVGATRFYERREVRDILAYLRFIANPSDSASLARIINIPPRKIGSTTVRALVEWSDRQGVSLWQAVRSASTIDAIGSAGKRQLSRAVELFEEMLEFAAEHTVLELLEHVIDATGYEAYIKADPEGQDRWSNVLELRSVAEDFDELDPREGLQAMLEHSALVSDADEVEASEGFVTLMTLHLAKGLEFDVVFLSGMEDGVFPHSRSLEDSSGGQLEEERRLCYVGITRAKEHLYVTYAVARTLMGRTHRNPPSRFMLDIPEELLTPDSNPPLRAVNRALETNWFSREPEPAESHRPEISEQIFAPGDRVYHRHFGSGTVVGSRLSSGDEEVTVRFEAKGKPVEKTLSVIYSGIEHA